MQHVTNETNSNVACKWECSLIKHPRVPVARSLPMPLIPFDFVF